MSKQAEVVSFFEVTSPVTNIGVRLGEPVELATPQFLIHESGYLPRGISDWSSGLVITPFWCFWYFSGEGHWMECDGQRWDIGPDCIGFGPAHVGLSTHNSGRAPHLWMQFSLVPDYVFTVSKPFTIPITPLLREHINIIIETHLNAKDDEARLLYHYSSALLHMCFAQHPLHLRVLPDALRAVLHEIESAPGADHSNARLAHLAGLSPSRFVAWFETYMNESPAAYVRRVRHDRASRMLAFSDLSIKQIAAELGFPNRHYFTRAFAQHTGYGPATFRKNFRGSAIYSAFTVS